MIRLLIALAVALGVLSLPLHATAAGKTLRRLAQLCFALALLPSLVVGLLFPGAKAAGGSHPFLTAGALLVAMVLAYGVYRLRVWLREDPAKQARLMEKTPIEQARRQNDVLAAILNNTNQQPPQGPTP